MRVLHVIPAVAPRYGGPSTAVYGMCRSLRNVGVDAWVATTDADGERRLAVPLEEVADHRGVPTIYFRRQFHEGFKFSLSLSRWLKRHCGEFDVLHVHAVYSHACLAAATAARARGVPYLIRPLGSLTPWASGRRGATKRALWHIGVRKMLRDAAAIHYTSRLEQRLSESQYQLENGIVVPLGVQASIGSGEPPELSPLLRDSPYVLALGRLHPVKGLERLIEVFLNVTESEPLKGWRLVIGGEGDPAYTASLREQVERRSAGGRVVFLGWLSGSRKEETLRGAAFLALPSQQENFGVAAVEAMCRGVPVLVSDQVGLADEIAAAGAGWVTPLDQEAMSAQLREAMTSSAGRARRGHAAIALTNSRFTWERVAGQLCLAYRSVLRGSTVTDAIGAQTAGDESSNQLEGVGDISLRGARCAQ